MRLWAIALLASGCGRIGFDATGAGPSDGDVVLPTAPVPLASPGGFASCIQMVWSGQDLAVFWTDMLDNRLRFARVAPDGTIVVPERLFGTTASSCPAAAWTGSSYAVAWGNGDVTLALVDTDGAETGEVTVALGNAYPSVAWDGGEIGVIYVDTTTMTTRFRAFAGDGSSLGAVVDVTPGDFTARIAGLPGGGFAMVHGTNSAAEYVELDQAGGVTTAPLFVADRFTVRALAHGPQRFAIGYEALDFAPTVRTGTAALANQPHALGVPEMIVADVVPVGDGFALAWIEDDGTESAHGELRFTGVDADGVPVTPIVRVTDHSATASVAAIDQNTFAVAFDTFGTPMLAVFDAP